MYNLFVSALHVAMLSGETCMATYARECSKQLFCKGDIPNYSPRCFHLIAAAHQRAEEVLVGWEAEHFSVDVLPAALLCVVQDCRTRRYRGTLKPCFMPNRT
jgi:hypothetical protein